MKPVPYQLSDNGPADRRRDCAVVALSNALEISYFESEKFWLDNGRKINHPTNTRGILGDKKVIGNKVLIKANNSPISLNQFLLTRPQGSYLVRKRGHVFAVKNGLVLDHLKRPCGGRTMLTHIWKVEDLNGNTPAPINLITIKPITPVVEKNKLEKFSWLNKYLE